MTQYILREIRKYQKLYQKISIRSSPDAHPKSSSPLTSNIFPGPEKRKVMRHSALGEGPNFGRILACTYLSAQNSGPRQEQSVASLSFSLVSKQLLVAGHSKRDFSN